MQLRPGALFNPGDTVDLYYYGEANTVRSVAGKVEELDHLGLAIVTTVTGALQFYPWGSVQRVILLRAFEQPLK